jgi:hypothetical protein
VLLSAHVREKITPLLLPKQIIRTTW